MNQLGWFAQFVMRSLCWATRGHQEITVYQGQIVRLSPLLVDIWYARVRDEPEILVPTGNPETQLRYETQQLIRFGILKLVFADFDSRRRL